MSVKLLRKVLCFQTRAQWHSISLHELHNLYFQFSDGSSSSTAIAYFALQLQMPDFSTAEEVRYAFCSIFNDMQQAIPGLEDFSFSHGVPEGSIAHICGNLHSSSKIAEASVQGWFSDARIPPETTRWTPVWPGKNCDWRQDPQIQSISASCKGGSRQVEHCIKGSRPDAAWKGGLHKKTPVAPGEGDTPPRAAQGSNTADCATDRRRRRATTTSRRMCCPNSPE